MTHTCVTQPRGVNIAALTKAEAVIEHANERWLAKANQHFIAEHCFPDITDQIHNLTMQSHIPQCTSPTYHNARFCNRNVHVCPYFCYKRLNCGIFVKCIVGFARLVYCSCISHILVFRKTIMNGECGYLYGLSLKRLETTYCIWF